MPALYALTQVHASSGAKPRGEGVGEGEVQTPNSSQRRLVGFAQIRWDISAFRDGIRHRTEENS